MSHPPAAPSSGTGNNPTPQPIPQVQLNGGRSTGGTQESPVAVPTFPGSFHASPVILKAERKIESELQGSEPPLQVAHDAWFALAKAQAEHLSLAGIEAARLARADQLGTVDALHVRAANRYIVGSHVERAWRLQPCPSAVLSPALDYNSASRYSIDSTDPPLTPGDFLTAFLPTLIGVVMMLVGLLIKKR